jgi:hypothetical protein
MALHFVSTAVLSSEDGIEFSKEIQLETEEARKTRQAAENASKRPLYMQLAEQQDKKQAEYDANTKAMFGELNFLDYLYLL